MIWFGSFSCDNGAIVYRCIFKKKEKETRISKIDLVSLKKRTRKVLIKKYLIDI